MKLVPKCAQLFLACTRIVGVTLCLPLLAEGRKQLGKRGSYVGISTVLRSLSDDVVRNLERFTCLMYSSSTEQTEVNMLQKEQFTIWEQTTRKSASNEGEREREKCFI